MVTRRRAAPAPEPVTGPDLGPIDEDEFWEAREELRVIRRYAQSCRAAPWAVLGYVLARALASVPPSTVLPPIGKNGGDGSLNLFIAMVGRSGAGKGEATRAAETLLPVDGMPVVGVGSGEGIAHAFGRREGGPKGGFIQTEVRAMIDIAEIETLGAMRDRKGSTIFPELRKAWFGESLGFQYADPAKRLPIKPHTYRLLLVAGVQPARASALLDDADGGTPQRFLWFPTSDPHAPDEAPDCDAGEFQLKPQDDDTGHRERRRRMTVCAAARGEIDAERLLWLREGEGEYPAHALLGRLKVAAALGILSGGGGVTDEDWHLAGVVIQVSNATRRWVEQLSRDKSKRANHMRGVSDGERQVASAAVVYAVAVKRVKGVILRRLERPGVIKKRQLRDAVGRDREYFDAALDGLLDDALVVLADGKYSLVR